MKKIISLLMLIMIFISVFQNIVLGAFEVEYGDIKKGKAIQTDVEFFDIEYNNWYPIEANYVYYRSPEGDFPAYCVSHRERWGGRSGKLPSKCG